MSEIWSKCIFEDGLQAVAEKHYVGNRRNMSFEEETEFLESFGQKAKQGQMLDIHEMKKAYQEKVGHSIGHSQIYYIFHRPGWRKIMPRSKHPKKASEEAVKNSTKNPRLSN